MCSLVEESPSSDLWYLAANIQDFYETFFVWSIFKRQRIKAHIVSINTQCCLRLNLRRSNMETNLDIDEANFFVQNLTHATLSINYLQNLTCATLSINYVHNLTLATWSINYLQNLTRATWSINYLLLFRGWVTSQGCSPGIFSMSILVDWKQYKNS